MLAIRLRSNTLVQSRFLMVVVPPDLPRTLRTIISSGRPSLLELRLLPLFNPYPLKSRIKYSTTHSWEQYKLLDMAECLAYDPYSREKTVP